MASSKKFARLYLYKNNPQGCCNYWFGEDTDSCMKSIIQSTYIDTNNAQAADAATVDRTRMWYPILDEYMCKNDGSIPQWMLDKSITKSYLYQSRQECNIAFGFSEADATAVDKMWYPNFGENKCENDGSVPSWMLGQPKLYLHHSRKQCHDTFGFS